MQPILEDLAALLGERYVFLLHKEKKKREHKYYPMSVKAAKGVGRPPTNASYVNDDYFVFPLLVNHFAGERNMISTVFMLKNGVMNNAPGHGHLLCFMVAASIANICLVRAVKYLGYW